MAVLGCVAVVSGASAAAVSLSKDSAAVATVGPSADVVKYWGDTRSALSPLLLYVRILPESIRALERGDGRVSDGQRRQAKAMAESFATSRDLVGRLTVPTSVRADVGELMQLACQLYRQSALALADGTLHRADVFHQIGDRLIDQVRRVLAIDSSGPGQAHLEFRYAAPVPTLAEVTGTPAEHKPVTASIDSSLAAAYQALHAGDRSALSAVASALENTAGAQGEDVVAARLAILLAIVGEDAPALELLSTVLWNTARTLSPEPRRAIEVLSTDVSRSAVWTGGVFDGRPPAIKPGEGVGSGLPGGLPSIDPMKILRG